MNCNVTIDWRFAVALGGVVMLSIFVSKLDSAAAERVLACAVDACKEYAVASKSNR